MVVRSAKPDEQIRMSQIAAEAFWDDELQGAITLPYRNEYPEDAHLYWLSRIRKAWADPRNNFMVSTVVDGEGDKVVAWAQFVRKGTPPERNGNEAQSEYLEELPPNRAASREDEDVLERAYKCVLHEWSGSRAECWDISWLATDPAHQGQGHGKALMAWVIGQGTQEQVALSVIAAKGKDGFYNKLGYIVPSGKLSEGENNPLHGRIEGCQFWWKGDHLATKEN